MTEDSLSHGDAAPVSRALEAWLALDRGWQAVALGVIIVVGCHLIA